MATPQKIFLENIHFWIFPLILIFLKILFDFLPKIIFFPFFFLSIFFLISRNKYQEKQEELNIKELENQADLFLDELNELEKLKEEKAKKLKEKKEKLLEVRLKNQEKQKFEKLQKSKSISDKDDDEDEDEDLTRMSQFKKRK